MTSGTTPVAVVLVAVTVALAGCGALVAGDSSTEPEPTNWSSEWDNETGTPTIGSTTTTTATSRTAAATATPTRIPTDDVRYEIDALTDADKLRVKDIGDGYAVLLVLNTTSMQELGKQMEFTNRAVYNLNERGRLGTVQITYVWEGMQPVQHTVNETMLNNLESGEWDITEFEKQVALTSERVNRTEWDE